MKAPQVFQLSITVWRGFLGGAVLLSQSAVADVTCEGLVLPDEVAYTAVWRPDPPEPGVPTFYSLHVDMEAIVHQMCVLVSDDEDIGGQSWTNSSLNNFVHGEIADELLRWEANRPPLLAQHPVTGTYWTVPPVPTAPAEIQLHENYPVFTVNAKRIKVAVILDKVELLKSLNLNSAPQETLTAARHLAAVYIISGRLLLAAVWKQSMKATGGIGTQITSRQERQRYGSEGVLQVTSTAT